MPRTYHKKGVHTSPEKAGVMNLEGKDFPKDEEGLMSKLMPIYKKGNENRGIYKGQWSDQELMDEIDKYFQYCVDVELKPTQPSLRLWLGVTRTTIWEWRTKPEKYGVKSNIIEQAFDVMEMYLQSNLDKYPTGSIFLLKSSFGHKDTMNVQIDNTNTVKPDEVADVVAKLGLDKPKQDAE